MRSLTYRLHTWLGIEVALPVLGWASSGLIYAWPNGLQGGEIERIQASRIVVTPTEAMNRANQSAGRELPITALTLLVRDGKTVYQAIGGMGAESILIDAEKGTVVPTPPAGFQARFFRHAHFFYFAGSWQVALLVTFSLLACLSAGSGIYLNLHLWSRKDRKLAKVIE